MSERFMRSLFHSLKSKAGHMLTHLLIIVSAVTILAAVALVLIVLDTMLHSLFD